MRATATLLAAVLVMATLPGRAEPGDARSASVTYVSGTTVYVSAGSDDGLAVGGVVEVVRDGAIVARLTVTTVSAHRASCVPQGDAPVIVAGDAVRFLPAAAVPAAAEAAPPAEAPARSGESAFRRAGLRGRIGARYLWIADRTGRGQDLSQPSIDLFLAGTEVGGAPVDLAIDARTRRTYRTPSGGATVDEGRTRLYQASVAWRPGSFRVAAGRQTAPTLAVVTLFDGLVGEYRGRGWTAGLLAGSQPDPESYAPSGDVRQYGAYARYDAAASAATRWGIGFGAISSTEDGETNRDLAYVEARLTRDRVWLYVQQQVDVNRGWRKDAEGESFTPSATFAVVRARPADAWSLEAGYDSRRNVRLYRDIITPVTDFDDATRQGYWLGGSWRPRNRWLVGVDGRRATGGEAGTADTLTLRLGATNLSAQAIDVRFRGTGYEGPYVEGIIAELSASMNWGTRVRGEGHGGWRQDTDLRGFDLKTDVTWIGFGVEALLGRHVFGSVAYDRTSGGDEDNDQAYFAVSWRF